MLARWLAGEILHVGRTSVPSLGAKPVIDILAEVSSLEESRAAIEPLQTLSYWRFSVPSRADELGGLADRD